MSFLIPICLWMSLQLVVVGGSIVNTSPGLSLRPKPPGDGDNLIWYREDEPNSYHAFVQDLSTLLMSYERDESDSGQNIEKCYFRNPPSDGAACHFDINSLYPCTQERNFGYNQSTPCIFLELDKVYGWKPSIFNSSDDLPPAMPYDLKENIKVISAYDKERLNMLWVSCEGKQPADKENIGPIQYLPRRGFPGYYFPYTNQEGYLSPLVAIFFEKPQKGVVISIQCTAWAPNVEYALRNVQFDILVE